MTLDKEFETAQESAVRLGLSVRAIQKQASLGRIPGAQRHGRSWLIPRSYDPSTKTNQVKSESNGIPDVYQVTPFRLAMPLLNSAYPAGKAMEFIQAMPDADDRQIALAEYYFFAGRSEEAAITAEPYMDSHDPALRFSASLICTFANLARGHTHLTRFAMTNLHGQVAAGLHSDAPPPFHAMGVFTATAAQVLLHLPVGDVPPLEKHLSALPDGLKLYACYLLAHKAYLDKEYARCLTIAELSLALSPKLYPIAAVYVHIVAAMALVNMKRIEEAKQHIDEAWKIAQPDDLIQPFGEHHGLLQGMIEVYFKKSHPALFERIIAITYAFSAGWRRIHNPDTQHDVADNLTTTEFTIAMLYSRGWMVKEIASHLEVSERTISNRIADIFAKLGVNSRNDLSRFMLT